LHELAAGYRPLVIGELSPMHWMVVIGVFMVLFGAKRLPEAARGLGRSMRILKAELGADDATPTSTETVAGAPVPLTYTAPTVVGPSAVTPAPPVATAAAD
jgi:sec-independent protein translocase protein TatA